MRFRDYSDRIIKVVFSSESTQLVVGHWKQKLICIEQKAININIYKNINNNNATKSHEQIKNKTSS